MRGHYGNFEQANCLECSEPFTKKQPGQKYCWFGCQEKANHRQQRRKARAR